MKKIFKAKYGSRINNKQAKEYGEHLDELIKIHGNKLTPKNVIDDAEKEESPLHGFFEWNDGKAAREWRLQQARVLMGSITVEIIELDSPTENLEIELPENIRGFSNITEEKTEGRIYVNIDRIAKEENLRQYLVKQAWKALLHWKQQYKEYIEFDKIIKAIEETEKNNLV